MTTLYPRLPDIEARIALKRIRSAAGSPDVRREAGCEHRRAYFAPTGGRPAGRDQLERLAEAVRRCAGEFGYPGMAKVGEQRLIEFDRALARVVFSEMDLVPAEAAVPEIWSFMAVRLLPDVVAWRWQQGFNEERWIGRTLVRHTFGRVWWQAHALGRPTPYGRDYSLLDSLSESDLNQIFERRSIGGNTELARALALELADARIMQSASPRRDVIRDVTKRISRVIPFTSFPSMDDAQLKTRLHAIVDESLDALDAER